jgi:hypothetical protein
MKTKLALAQATALFSAFCYIRGQGTFVYDQQSFSSTIPPNITYQIEANQPIGQSFTPTLSAVGFVQLELGDSVNLNGVGATVYVNLRADSITGPVLSSTEPVFMPDNFFGATNFFFSSPISVTPQTTYYFQPVVQSGDSWVVNTALGDDYPRGTMYYQGAVLRNFDFWFREGLIVPEPSSTGLLLIGSGVLFYVRRMHLKRRCASRAGSP